MKEVCHHKDSTNSFVLKKLAQKPVDVIATRYGRRHENSAIVSYVNNHRAHGVMINVQPCGLCVDASDPRLAASPDGIVMILHNVLINRKVAWKQNVHFYVKSH